MLSCRIIRQAASWRDRTGSLESARRKGNYLNYSVKSKIKIIHLNVDTVKTNDLLQTIVLNFHTALFLKEFDACTRDTPQCTLEDFRSAFISKHEILQQSEPLFPFSPYNQGTAISLAYSFIVLPFESGDDIEKWNPDIQSLKKFTVTKQPKDFIPSNGKMLKYLRHSIAHANIEIKPKVGRNHGEASVCLALRII